VSRGSLSPWLLRRLRCAAAAVARLVSAATICDEQASEILRGREVHAHTNLSPFAHVSMACIGCFTASHGLQSDASDL